MVGFAYGLPLFPLRLTHNKPHQERRRDMERRRPKKQRRQSQTYGS